MNIISKIPYAVLIFFLSLKYQLVLGQNRIIGGDTIEIEKIPYVVYLRIPLPGHKVSECGGAIIGKEWGLTAAHCFRHLNTKWNEVTVSAGRVDLLNTPKTYQSHQLIEHHMHELFQNPRNRSVAADIAVFKVSPPFTFNEGVQPIKLPEEGQHYNTSWGTVGGWGALYKGGRPVDRLRVVKLPKMSNKNCEDKMTRKRLRIGEVCYGATKGTTPHNTCKGDSGSPLVSSERVVIGVLSWGINCDTVGYPTIFTNTQLYRNWIKEKTGI